MVRVIVLSTAMVVLFVLALGMIAIPREQTVAMTTGLVALPASEAALESTPEIELQSARSGPNPNSGGEPKPLGSGPFNAVDHTAGGLNATALHVFDGTDSTRQLPRTTGRVYHHITNPGYPDHTSYTWLVHVASGPEKTRVVRTDMVHGAVQGPDFTRYFPPGWNHKNLPGPHQTVYIGPNWYHQALTTVWLPPGGGFGGTGFHGSEPGPDQTDLIGPGGFHIYESPDPAQNSTYVWGPGVTDATHIKYGPDTTRYAPHEHRTSQAHASTYAPGGWEHITSGPFSTTWHPPGWEHKTLGPNNTNYLPGDYFHATLSPPATNGGGMMEPEDSATNYLPPGWMHASNTASQEYTTYVPPGFFHATEWGGMWPHPDVGLNPGSGRWNYAQTDYVQSGFSHIANPTWADYTRYAPGTGATHIGNGADATHWIPTDWIHVAIQGFTEGGSTVSPSRYVEPNWQHSTSPEAAHGPTTYVINS